MDFIADVVAWLTDGDHWTGSSGIPVLVRQHLQVSFAAVLVGGLVGVTLGLVLGHVRRGGVVAVNVANIGRAIPTFALLVLFVQIFGISSPRGLGWTGSAATFFALTLLAIPPMLTNTYVGVSNIDPALTEAARGMGMPARAVLARVELPIALPLMIAGIRTAALNVVATATLASFTGFETLGTPVIVGIRVNDHVQTFAGSLLVIALAAAVELALAGVQRAVVSPGLTPNVSRRRRRPLREPALA